MIVVTPSPGSGVALSKGITPRECAAIESFEKMTAAVAGREKTVFNNLVNNNNVKGRIAQFSKYGQGWKPPQTFAVGFWANREMSGSTLTLYEDIVSSESEDEDSNGKPTSKRQPSHLSAQQLNKRASVESRSSYKHAIDRGAISMSTAKPPENNSVNKMQYCQEWLTPQQQSQRVPVIGNVGTGNYNRLQSTSKWDAHKKLPHASTTFSSSVKTTTIVNIYNAVQKSQRSEVLKPTQLYPTNTAAQTSGEFSRMDSRLSDNSSHSPGRRSRPSSVCSTGSAGSRPPTPSQESRGPLMSPPCRNKPLSPSPLKKYSCNPMSASMVSSAKQAGGKPVSVSASRSTEEFMHITQARQMYPEVTEDRSESPHVRRSISSDSTQQEKRKSDHTPAVTYKTEVHINVSPFYKKPDQQQTTPVPAPRRVARTMSAASTRPHTVIYNHESDYQNVRRVSAGSIYSHQSASAALSEDSDSEDDVASATNVNLFNVNTAAVVDRASDCEQETEARNIRNLEYHQPKSAQLSKALSMKKKPYPEIMPRNTVLPDYVNISPTMSKSDSGNTAMETLPVTSRVHGTATQNYRDSSPVYDNLILYNNNDSVDHQHCDQNIYENVDLSIMGPHGKLAAMAKTCQSAALPSGLQNANEDIHSSWDKLSLTSIEFQTQCAQVCTLPFTFLAHDQRQCNAQKMGGIN